MGSRGRQSALLALAALLVPLACGARSDISDDGGTDGGALDGDLADALGASDGSKNPESDGATASDAPSALDASPSHDSGPLPEPPPRLLAPLSTERVTSHSPVLRWLLAKGTDGAQIDICRDRACTTLVTKFTVTGSSAIPPVALAQGVYFWRARGALGDTVGTVNSPVWQFHVGVENAPKSTSWGSVLDVNGDGFAEVMIGSSNVSGASETVYLYQGGLGGLATTPTSWTYANHPNGYYRDPIASAGDIDGDGFEEVLLGVPDPNAKVGAVHIYKGGASGLSTTPTVLPAPSGVDSSFGWNVAGGGDINGDGYADVLVGAPFSAGGVFVYYGGPSGLTGAPTVFTTETIPGNQTAYLGASETSAGDVNGDGFADVIMGSWGGNYAFLYLGSAAGLSRPPTMLPSPHHPGQIDQNPGFGFSVAGTGDVNGDGYADILIGAPGDGDNYNNTGSTYVYFGSAAGLVTAPVRLVNPTADTGSGFGAAVGPAGDVNGDGYDDMLSAIDHGSFVFYGGPTGSASQGIPLPIFGQNILFRQGCLGAAWDVDGDGFDDLLTGAPDANNWSGDAELYLGGTLGPSAPIPLVHPTVPNGFFGSSVAWSEEEGAPTRLAASPLVDLPQIAGSAGSGGGSERGRRPRARRAPRGRR